MKKVCPICKKPYSEIAINEAATTRIYIHKPIPKQGQAPRLFCHEKISVEDQMKIWIDTASYEELLRKTRYAPIGDPFFQDELGVYFRKVRQRKKAEVGIEEAIRISKKIGWN